MTDPIRVLHFADVHIGMENYGRLNPDTGLNTRLEDFADRMDEMVAYAREHEVDLVIFAGDAYKNRKPDPTYQRKFAARIQDLAELAPVVMLVGNHDLPPNADKASSVEIFSTLRVPNVLVADAYSAEPVIVQTKRGAVAVGAVPYPMRGRVLEIEAMAGKTIAEGDELLKSRVRETLEQLAEAVQPLDMPRLLTGHFAITGAKDSSERTLMLGQDIEVSLSAVAAPCWDYVAMGHIHKHQNLTYNREGMPPVVYSGSLERIDFGEAHDSKGFCWVELARGETTWQFVPVRSRPFMTVECDLRESLDPTGDVLLEAETHDLTDAVVRVRMQLTPEQARHLNENTLREALRQQGAHMVAAFDKQIDQPLRVKLAGAIDGLSDLELLDRHLASVGKGTERREALVNTARSLLDTLQLHS